MYKFEIRNIRRGRVTDGRDKYVYAELWRIPTLQNVLGTPELVISATLDYITEALNDRERNLI
jgi:hypothetical protein